MIQSDSTDDSMRLWIGNRSELNPDCSEQRPLRPDSCKSNAKANTMASQVEARPGRQIGVALISDSGEW